MWTSITIAIHIMISEYGKLHMFHTIYLVYSMLVQWVMINFQVQLGVNDYFLKSSSCSKGLLYFHFLWPNYYHDYRHKPLQSMLRSNFPCSLCVRSFWTSSTSPLLADSNSWFSGSMISSSSDWSIDPVSFSGSPPSAMVNYQSDTIIYNLQQTSHIPLSCL